ncbi:hypothetical protein WN943_011050 [Citrus x changshan-huyou]
MVLKKGDVFVFLVGLVHFKCNVGYGNVVAIVAFSSQNLGVVTIANTAFGSNPAIVTDTLAKAFQAEKKIVKQLQSTADGDNRDSLSFRDKLMESQRTFVDELSSGDGDLDFEPENIVVEHELPGMAPYYYHKRVLRMLGQVIGKVRKVENENLLNICFGCGKYGHSCESCPDRVVTNDTVGKKRLSYALKSVEVMPEKGTEDGL